MQQVTISKDRGIEPKPTPWAKDEIQKKENGA